MKTMKEKRGKKLSAIEGKLKAMENKLDHIVGMLSAAAEQGQKQQDISIDGSIMESSIDEIHVETGSEEEIHDVAEAKEKLKAIIHDVVTGNKGDSNQKEWELLVEIKDDKKKLRKNGNAEEIRKAGEEALNELSEELERKKEDALSKQKEELTKEKNDALSEQEKKLTNEKNDALTEQEEKLTKEKNDALSEQEKKLTNEKNDALSKQKEELTKEKNDALTEQEKELTKEKNDALSEREKKLTNEKNDALTEQEKKLTNEKNNALTEQEEMLTKEKKDALSEQEKKLTNEKNDALSKQKEELTKEKNDALTEQEKQLKEEKEDSLQSQKEGYENKINAKKQEFDEAVKEYKLFLEYMVQCDSMASLVEELEIQDAQNITIHDALAIANLVGRDFSFADLIYNTISTYQKQRAEEKIANALTATEMEFIQAINSYYKSLYDEEFIQEFDVLDCLGFETDSKVSFDRKSMRDLYNNRNTDFLDAVELYVPAFRKTKDEITYKAYIKGK